MDNANMGREILKGTAGGLRLRLASGLTTYYIERLGFQLDFQGPDDGPHYAGVTRELRARCQRCDYTVVT